MFTRHILLAKNIFGETALSPGVAACHDFFLVTPTYDCLPIPLDRITRLLFRPCLFVALSPNKRFIILLYCRTYFYLERVPFWESDLFTFCSKSVILCLFQPTVRLKEPHDQGHRTPWCFAQPLPDCFPERPHTSINSFAKGHTTRYSHSFCPRLASRTFI